MCYKHGALNGAIAEEPKAEWLAPWGECAQGSGTMRLCLATLLSMLVPAVASAQAVDGDAGVLVEPDADVVTDAESVPLGEDVHVADESVDEPREATDAPIAPMPTVAATLRYSLERVRIEGNTGTADHVVRRFVPLEPGDVLDVEDPALEEVRWRLLGTGWFAKVRLRLEKGSQPGWVVLVVQVEERNTILIQQLAFGLSQAVDRTSDSSAEVQPYLGLSVAETNFLGLGKLLSVSALASERQQGVLLQYADPVFLGSKFSLRADLSYRNGLEFFGNDPLVSITCPPLEDPEDECPPEVAARDAVVLYERFGAGIGIGHDLTSFTQYYLDWHIDVIEPSVVPNTISESLGTGVDPVEVYVQRGTSFHSALRIGLDWDKRNDPALTSEGVLIRFEGSLGTSFLGGDYDYLKAQALARYWLPLGGQQYLRFGVFGGFISGDAPFFQRFFLSDLSDLIPSRLLEMNIDRRRAPNLLGNAISEFRSGDIAGRVDLEYGVPVLRTDGFLRSLHGYVGAGLYWISSKEHLRISTPGYEGAAAIPADLTFDLGLRADTSVGVFQLGLSTLLGFFVL